MVMAAGTAHRQAEENRRGSIHAIHHVLDCVLFRNDATLAIAAMVAIEAGGDDLIARWIRQQVAGQLLRCEAVIRHVAIERIDHPVAPAVHGALGVGLISIGVGIPRGIEPAHRHALAIARRGEQPIHYLFVSVRRRVIHKCLHVGRRRRQSRQVERDAPQQGALVRFGRRLKPLAIQPCHHEIVDWVLGPRAIADRREIGTYRRNKRPVILPRGALRDPPCEQVDFGILQLRRSGPRRRHASRRVGRTNPADHLTGARLARHNRKVAPEIAFCEVLQVEAQLTLAFTIVGAVAGKTVLGKDGANVAVELNRFVRRAHGAAKTHHRA